MPTDVAPPPTPAYSRPVRRVVRRRGHRAAEGPEAEDWPVGAVVAGLALEAATLKEGYDPLLYRERRAYLKGIQDALAGAETARAALAGACRRMEGP
jgi:hypothetical protein